MSSSPPAAPVPAHAFSSAGYFEGAEEVKQSSPPYQSPPSEHDPLLASNRGAIPLARPVYPRGSISLPVNYPSPPRETLFRPYPIATGVDEHGAFEVFPATIHPPGRHYHARKDDTRVSYFPCPPCVTADSAHQPQEHFTVPAWILAICCFPCGLLCCCFMKEATCQKCGAYLEK